MKRVVVCRGDGGGVDECRLRQRDDRRERDSAHTDVAVRRFRDVDRVADRADARLAGRRRPVGDAPADADGAQRRGEPGKRHARLRVPDLRQHQFHRQRRRAERLLRHHRQQDRRARGSQRQDELHGRLRPAARHEDVLARAPVPGHQHLGLVVHGDVQDPDRRLQQARRAVRPADGRRDGWRARGRHHVRRRERHQAGLAQQLRSLPAAPDGDVRRVLDGSGRAAAQQPDPVGVLRQQAEDFRHAGRRRRLHDQQLAHRRAIQGPGGESPQLHPVPGHVRR